MSRRGPRWSPLLLLGAWSLAGASGLPWQVGQDPHELARIGGHHASYLASSHCLDGCRYDRSSAGTEFGGPRFVRYDATPDGIEAVLLDQPGAGAITRIWMTMGDGGGGSRLLPHDVRLRVYVDGDVQAVVDEPLDEFFVAPFLPRRSVGALASDRRRNSGGNVSYRPIAYRDGIRIALLGGADLTLWYQIEYTQVADAAVVAESGPVDAAALAHRLGRGAFIDSLAAARRPARTDRPVFPGADAQRGSVASGQPLVLADRTGAGWIDALRIRVERARWADLDILFTFDGETTVDTTLDAFFTASALDPRDPRGVFAGVAAGDVLYADLPMPFRDSARISLRLRNGVAPVAVEWSVAGDDEAPPADAGTFRVEERAACPTDPARDGDFTILEYAGSGRLVGLAARMMAADGQVGGYYLEGDERTYIDASVQPLRYGTGVEDLFNGGFYFDLGPYAGPLAGATLRQPGLAEDATAMYRWFLTDAPTWRHSIRLRLENGPFGNQPMCVHTLAYYYAQAEPSQVPVAVLQLGDAASEAAARYEPAADARCAVQTASFGDEPPTERSARVCTGTGVSRFAFEVPVAGRHFRLRRTFAAGIGGQQAELWVNGERVGGWPALQVNPTRRWSQFDVDFALSQPTSTLQFEVRPLDGAFVTESAYELWADTAGMAAQPERAPSCDSALCKRREAATMRDGPQDAMPTTDNHPDRIGEMR